LGVAPQQSCRPMPHERADLKISSHPPSPQCHIYFTMPWTPTRAFPSPLARFRGTAAKPSVLIGAPFTVRPGVGCWLGIGLPPAELLCCAALPRFFLAQAGADNLLLLSIYISRQPAGRFRNCVCTAVAARHTATAGLCMCPSHWQWETACQRTSFMYVMLSDSDMQACATTCPTGRWRTTYTWGCAARFATSAGS